MPQITKRQLMQKVKGRSVRLSYYKMIRSDDFHELCYYYLSGSGLKDLEQFTALAGKLESTFSPPL